MSTGGRAGEPRTDILDHVRRHEERTKAMASHRELLESIRASMSDGEKRGLGNLSVQRPSDKRGKSERRDEAAEGVAPTAHAPPLQTQVSSPFSSSGTTQSRSATFGRQSSQPPLQHSSHGDAPKPVSASVAPLATAAGNVEDKAMAPAQCLAPIISRHSRQRARIARDATVHRDPTAASLAVPPPRPPNDPEDSLRRETVIFLNAVIRTRLIQLGYLVPGSNGGLERPCGTA